jgi:hypothetical protein
MSRKEINSTIKMIRGRAVPGGGFSELPDMTYRVDATAWAILALRTDGTHTSVVDAARSRLASEQQNDGRICLSLGHLNVIWPTALAILAWNGSSAYRKCQDAAIHFLLEAKGRSSAEGGGSITPIDFSLVGWPWVEETYSWVEPTALSILALTCSGHGKHERVHEATRLLMDRQLPSGGWNVGSTIVYGRESYPQIENTGVALSALSGQVERGQIGQSLQFLGGQATNCRTPLSLGWALLGLGAWKERPPEASHWVLECLSRQKKCGAYGTTLLSLMLLAHEAKGGFPEAIS